MNGSVWGLVPALLAVTALVSARSDAIDELRHSNGRIRMLRAAPADRAVSRSIDETARVFLDEHFSGMAPGFRLVESKRFSDAQHTHIRYELMYGDRPVFGQGVRAHFLHDGNRGMGRLHFATSSITATVETAPREAKRSLGDEAIRALLTERHALRAGHSRIDLARVYHQLPSGELVPAVDAWVYSNRPVFTRRFLLDERDGAVLDELQVYHFADATHNVYPVHPDDALGLSNETLAGTETFPVLSTGEFYVKRMRIDTVTAELNETEIAIGVDFDAIMGFDGTVHDGDNYDFTCNDTGTNECPNQSFDGVNLYYHMREYRTNIDAYLTALGASVDFALDPIEVVSNFLGFDLNGDGLGFDEVNNALYTPALLDVEGNIRAGLYFFGPADVLNFDDLCALRGEGSRPFPVLGPVRAPDGADVSRTVKFYNIAREAVTIVHEYQHYVTDMIADINPGSLSRPLVGGALHEGYSDYFGASQVSRLVGKDVTTIGDFYTKECPPFQRDISSLKVFKNQSSSNPAEDFTDIHIAGWTWASGLWQLREELGRDAVDRLALKSLLLSGKQPGFIDAIETLVAADEALFGGANVSRIRQLFYDELKFVGTLGPNLYRDPDSLLFEMGFRGCLAVGAGAGASGPVSIGGLLFWLLLTLWRGRRRW